jgi:hypothetical protein
VRDPLATVISHYRMVRRIAAIIHPHPPARRAVEEGLHLDVLTPRIKTGQYAETLALEQIHPLLGIAHQWRTMHLTALASLAANPALERQTLRISYEALTGDPFHVLGQVWHFVGLDDAVSAAITANAAADLRPPPVTQLTSEEARWAPVIDELVAPAAMHFGYTRFRTEEATV